VGLDVAQLDAVQQAVLHLFDAETPAAAPAVERSTGAASLASNSSNVGAAHAAAAAAAAAGTDTAHTHGVSPPNSSAAGSLSSTIAELQRCTHGHEFLRCMHRNCRSAAWQSQSRTALVLSQHTIMQSRTAVTALVLSQHTIRQSRTAVTCKLPCTRRDAHASAAVPSSCMAPR
jgi:hypothetical protein